MRIVICGVLLGLLFGCSEPPVSRETPQTPALAEVNTYRYTVLLNGNKVGHLQATHQLFASDPGHTVTVDYDYKSNGRGPAYQEEISLNNEGIPQNWQISGNTTFGNQVPLTNPPSTGMPPRSHPSPRFASGHRRLRGQYP